MIRLVSVVIYCDGKNYVLTLISRWRVIVRVMVFNATFNNISVISWLNAIFMYYFWFFFVFYCLFVCLFICLFFCLFCITSILLLFFALHRSYFCVLYYIDLTSVFCITSILLLFCVLHRSYFCFLYHMDRLLLCIIGRADVKYLFGYLMLKSNVVPLHVSVLEFNILIINVIRLICVYGLTILYTDV